MNSMHAHPIAERIGFEDIILFGGQRALADVSSACKLRARSCKSPISDGEAGSNREASTWVSQERTEKLVKRPKKTLVPGLKWMRSGGESL